MERFLSKRLVLLVLAAVLFLTAWNRGIPLLYLMFSLLLATVLLGQFLPYLALGSIEVERTAPRVSVVGDLVSLGFSLRNPGMLPSFMIEVCDFFPCGDYGRTEPLLFIPYLAAGGALHRELRVACAVRGEFTLGPLHLASAFPLGIARGQRQLPHYTHQLLVYPATFPIADLPIRPATTTHRESGESVSIAGGSEEFFGLREYRAGDSIRKVHWPSSARRNLLLVKEMEVRVSAQVTLLLDLYAPAHAGQGAEHSLEYAITIAASLCRHILERQHQAGLIGHGERLHLSLCRTGQEHLRELMTMLAKAKTGVVPFSRLLSVAEAQMQDGQSVVLICSGRSLEALEMRRALALLRAKRLQIMVVLVETSGFGGKDHPDLKRELASAGVRCHRLGKGDSFTSLFQTY